MWAYLDHVGDLLNNLLVAFHAIPASETALVRHSLSSVSRTYSFTGTHVGDEKLIIDGRKSVPCMTGEDGSLLPGVCAWRGGVCVTNDPSPLQESCST